MAFVFHCPSLHLERVFSQVWHRLAMFLQVSCTISFVLKVSPVHNFWSVWVIYLWQLSMFRVYDNCSFSCPYVRSLICWIHGLRKVPCVLLWALLGASCSPWILSRLGCVLLPNSFSTTSLLVLTNLWDRLVIILPEWLSICPQITSCNLLHLVLLFLKLYVFGSNKLLFV